MLCCDCLREWPENLSFKGLFCKKQMKFQHCYFCQKKYTLITKQHCPLCYRQQDDKEICEDCQTWQSLIKRKVANRAFFKYDQHFSQWIERFKYQGALHLKYTFAGLLNQTLKKEKALLVPIPMAEKKQAIRGFNQTEEILLGANLTFEPLLGKMDLEEIPQSQKNKKERMALKQSFYLKKEVETKEIILFDDIYTTGSTLQKAIEILENNGYQIKYTLTLAR